MTPSTPRCQIREVAGKPFRTAVARRNQQAIAAAAQAILRSRDNAGHRPIPEVRSQHRHRVAPLGAQGPCRVIGPVIQARGSQAHALLGVLRNGLSSSAVVQDGRYRAGSQTHMRGHCPQRYGGGQRRKGLAMVQVLPFRPLSRRPSIQVRTLGHGRCRLMPQWRPEFTE